jgi:hypothetical protein
MSIDLDLLLLFFLHKNIKIIKINNNPIIDPITIPAIAPPDNFFLLPSPPPFGLLGTTILLGTPSQPGRGFPHKEVPPKELIPKPLNLSGIDPFSKLLLTLNCSNFSSFKSGKDPDNELSSKNKVLNLIKLPNPVEISPVKLFSPRFNLTRSFKPNKKSGISPEKRFPCK